MALRFFVVPPATLGKKLIVVNPDPPTNDVAPDASVSMGTPMSLEEKEKTFVAPVPAAAKCKPCPTLSVVEPITQDWTIERIAKERPACGWEDVFRDAEPELHDVSEILEEDEKKHGMFFPLKRDIFRAFELTPLSQVKLVLIGMDPYPQRNSHSNRPRAQGLSFSVAKDDEIPSSLKNIYKELHDTVPGFITPTHGDLTEWACSGILLLNASLTVRPGSPGSHGDIWLGFISKVLNAIARKCPHTIYLLLGSNAQKLSRYLPDNAVVVTAAHPSGLSANRGFFGSNVFNKINNILVKQGKTPINWQISD